MNKTARNIMYVLVIAICIIAIIVGVYAQFFKRVTDEEEKQNITIGNTVIGNQTQAEIKQTFRELFENKFQSSEYSDANIQKIDDSKEIVYSAIDNYSDKKEGKYNISASVPLINISGTVTNRYNQLTQNIFVDKLNEIMQNDNQYTIFDIKYTAYVNNDILSVAIMGSLKEGENAQRLVVQSYNYNLITGKEVTINDILTARELEVDVINRRIKSVVTKAAEDARYMQNTGYSVYERQLDSDIYNVQNVTNFIQGPSGELYIIYAYGNGAFTSEMDIIEV